VASHKTEVGELELHLLSSKRHSLYIKRLLVLYWISQCYKKALKPARQEKEVRETI